MANAANSTLVSGYMRLAINKVRKALGIGQLGKLIAYTSVEQEHAWENLGITISQVIKQNAAGSASDPDLLFSGRKTMSGHCDQVLRQRRSDARGFSGPL